MTTARWRHACALLLATLALPAAAQPASCPEERSRAAEVRARIERDWPLRHSDAVTRFIQGFGTQLAIKAGIDQVSRWRFGVVQDTSINAYSIGDGLIYITEGAIVTAGDEADLAAVLAHEMGHDIAGHFCPRASQDRDQTPWWDIFSSKPPPPSRRQSLSYYGPLRQVIDPAKEQEADRNAAIIMRKAGYDPNARQRVAQRIARSRSDADRSGHPNHFSFLARQYPWVDPDQSGSSSSYQAAEFHRVQRLLANNHR